VEISIPKKLYNKGIKVSYEGPICDYCESGYCGGECDCDCEGDSYCDCDCDCVCVGPND
jgi:hypothetical protein